MNKIYLLEASRRNQNPIVFWIKTPVVMGEQLDAVPVPTWATWAS
jgi:hypothetical protein